MGILENLAQKAGSAIADIIKKPDGTSLDAIAQPSNIVQGAAQAVSSQISSITNSLSSASLNTASFTPSLNSAPKQRGYPNALENFASYTSLFTLVCLKPDQINNPFSYRNSSFQQKQVVFSSAGRYDAARAGTSVGAPEYFVNNLEIVNMITGSKQSGSSPAVKITFDVMEPYSMGLLLQSMQVAALAAGYPNYLKTAAFMLIIDFVGYDQDGNMFTGVKSKYFPLSLTSTTFSVTEAGSNYKVEAVPFNHKAFNSSYNTLFNDISIIGENIKELLAGKERSLVAVLNEQEEKLIREGTPNKGIPDVYEIHFPESASSPIPGVSSFGGSNTATVQSSSEKVVGSSVMSTYDPDSVGDNVISRSSFDFQIDSSGNYVAPKAVDTYDAESGKVDRDKVTIAPKQRTFQYTKDQSITELIQQCILETDYAAKALSGKFDPEGRISWFRVDVQIQLLSYDNKRQDYAKRIIFRVMPYKIHSSLFINPSAAAPGYDSLQEQIAKQYNYIYTGQNNDLLKFDIQLNNTFYTAIAPTAPHDAGGVQNKDQEGTGSHQYSKQVANEGEEPGEAANADTGGRTVQPDPNAMKKTAGGSGRETPELIVANLFQNAFKNSAQAEMVNMDFDILGDPYWLADSGYAGYFAGPGSSDQITEDDAVNYEAGDSYIYVRFRTPIEPKEDNGDYLFVAGESDSPFSGIYKVTEVTSKFNDGVFRQSLKSVRMPMQPNDFDSKPTIAAAETLAYKSGKPIKPATSPNEEADGATVETDP